MNHYGTLKSIFLAIVGTVGDPIPFGFAYLMKDLLLDKSIINMDFMTMAENGFPG